MKIVSLVPSWTELLVEAGFQVVGRTRYCIHPKGSVGSIKVVGGTKDTHWKKLTELQPDVILVDKEENRKEVLGHSKAHYHVTHVESIHDMPLEIDKLIILNQQFGGDKRVEQNLVDYKKRWQEVIKTPLQTDLVNLPGVLKWIHRPQSPVSKILYVIWKKPFMVVSKQTFIGSVLSHLGFEEEQFQFEKKYPQVELEKYLNDQTLLLFSSEPYAFGEEKELNWIKCLNTPAALVDGESFSWFGLRTLKFLESQNKQKSP